MSAPIMRPKQFYFGAVARDGKYKVTMEFGFTPTINKDCTLHKGSVIIVNEANIIHQGLLFDQKSIII